MNDQTRRNMMAAGLPVAVSEGSMTGRLSLTESGHAFDFWGGDGKVRRLVSTPYAVKRSRKQPVRRNSRCITTRPSAA